jgi:hypothetical protein
VVDGSAGNVGFVCGTDSEAEEIDATPEINRDGEGCLRTMRQAELQTSCSPQGQKSTEQLTREFTDFVCLLPSSYALAQLHGDAITSEALFALLKACGAERLVQYPPDQIEAVWRSLAQEVQDQIRMGFEKGGFMRTAEHPLAHGAPARVGRLRGYGNALCAPAAQAFIESYIEARKEQPLRSFSRCGNARGIVADSSG